MIWALALVVATPFVLLALLLLIAELERITVGAVRSLPRRRIGLRTSYGHSRPPEPADAEELLTILRRHGDLDPEASG